MRNASVLLYITSGVTSPCTSGITEAAIKAEPSSPSSASSRRSARAITIVAPMTQATADRMTRKNSRSGLAYVRSRQGPKPGDAQAADQRDGSKPSLHTTNIGAPSPQLEVCVHPQRSNGVVVWRACLGVSAYGREMAAIPVAPFGRSGHDSTRLIFGAAALGSMSQERADATMALVDSAGINHIDTAAGYGAVRDLLKPFLAHPDRFFLATKTGERKGDTARDSSSSTLSAPRPRISMCGRSGCAWRKSSASRGRCRRCGCRS